MIARLAGWPLTRSLCAVLAAVFLGLVVVLQPARAAGLVDAAALAERLDALRAEAGLNAVVVGIDRGGEQVFGAAGDSLPGEPATPAMTARIGAMSITAIATILLQLADEGVLSLDDPLERWRPGYPEGDRITLKMLANTTSGYADYVDAPAFVDAFYEDVFRVWTREELLRIALDRGLQNEPGEGFTYSHAGFAILADVLVAASGQPLEDLVTERIIVPLGLARTFFRHGGAGLTEPVLHAYTTERGVFENATFWSPSWTLETGVLTSDTPDLLRLARAFGTGELLTDSGFEAMLAPLTVGMRGMTGTSYFALGIQVRDGWIGQTFSFAGYAGMVAHDPEDDLTIAVVITQGRTSDPDINHATSLLWAVAEMVDR